MWSVRRPGPPSERQGEENEETPHDILKPSASAVEQEVSEDTVPRSARESGAGGELGLNANAGNLRIDLASNPVNFGNARSTPIFELSNFLIQLLFTMMIFYCWVYMGVDNDLHPLEKRIEENEYGEE
ncbi:jg17064 [Pararge aegeria aegeria]|uniref:Jg17064 protein n=1 Tax=Pararge aegeria aegeria TaxID=348720 RepID=A0A8S4R5G7_9NEOP|nr:jg17064 [Pararge aegeria aegeria]